MKCRNCGRELPADARFCPACGAKVEGSGTASQKEFQDTYRQSEMDRDLNIGKQKEESQEVGKEAGEGIAILLKYFGIACAVFCAVMALGSMLGMIRTLFRMIKYALWGFRYYGATVSGLVVIGMDMVKLAGYVAAASGFFLAGFCYKKGRSGSIFTLTAAGTLLLFVRYLFLLLMGSFLRRYVYGGRVTDFLFLLFLIMMTAFLFGLFYAVGDMPYSGGFREIETDMRKIPNVVKEGVGEVSKAFGMKKREMQWVQKDGQLKSAAFQQSGVAPLQTDRNLLVYILLTFVTCGLYSWYFVYKMAADVNVACAGDGKSTVGLAKFILLTFVTCGVYNWVWQYQLGNRLAENAPRYGMRFVENGTSVLMWLLFGSLCCGIGPFIAIHILIKNTNAICSAYNRTKNV